jgi:eukaryotic-like serine/threonine-protein kinase
MVMQYIHPIDYVVRDRYRLVEVLGQGGMGTTYRAEDLVDNRWVAVKVVSLRQVKDWKILELLAREVQVLKAIDHPAIPRYIDSFEIDAPPLRAFYLVQALAPGQSLADWVAAGWRPDQLEAQSIATQLLEVLVYLQTFTPAVIHRDLKPQNVIRDRDGKLALVDFGAVQDTFRHTVTGGSTVVGTLGYMAPEQFRGQATLSTDLYGLGMTLLFLLTGIDPVELPEENLQIDWRTAMQLANLHPESAFAQWLHSLIAPTIEQRLVNARTALAVLAGEQALPKRQGVERIRYRRVTVERAADALRIQIAPANLQQRRVQVIGLSILLYTLVTSFWFWLLIVTPYQESIDPAWPVGEIVVGFVLAALGWGSFPTLLQGLLGSDYLELTPQKLQLRQDFGLRPIQHPIARFKLKIVKLWLPYWGCLPYVCLLSAGEGRTCGFGLLLDAVEAELLQNQVDTFLAERSRRST